MTSDFRVGRSENGSKNWTKKVPRLDQVGKERYVSKLIFKKSWNLGLYIKYVFNLECGGG